MTTLDTTKAATINRGSERQQVWLGTHLYRPLLCGDQTDGRFAMADFAVRRGVGSPPHVHTREDEAFYILEGEMTFLLGDKLVVAKAGDFVWAPRGVPHNFTGSSDTPTRAVMLVTPTMFETFAATFTSPCTDTDAWPELTREQIESMLGNAPAYGIDIFPPTFKMPTLVQANAGPSARRWVMGEHVSYLATAEQTGGQFTVVEIKTASGGGPPPHVHVNGDEILYVITGRHRIMLDDHVDVAGPGDLVWLPRGTRHTYSNTEETRGKVLSIHTPGGFERFFDEVGVNADEYPTAPKNVVPPSDAHALLLARHDMTV